MDKSEFQKHVASSLENRETDKVNIAITDNENAIIIKVDDGDAAFTADEARELANTLRPNVEKWPPGAEDVIKYIEDLADVVDNNITFEEHNEKWDGQRSDSM